jgi:hypothetical protein
VAGSYRHVTNEDGTFRGADLLENGGDTYEAVEEMHAMIAWLAGQIDPANPRAAIHRAWREGYLRPLNNGNADIESIAGFDAFWGD